MALGVDIQGPQRDQLPDQPTPVGRGMCRPDAEGPQPVMLVPQHTLGPFPAQHRYDVRGAEYLIRAIHRRQHHLRLGRGIHRDRGCLAVVAVAAFGRLASRRSRSAATGCGTSPPRSARPSPPAWSASPACGPPARRTAPASAGPGRRPGRRTASSVSAGSPSRPARPICW